MSTDRETEPLLGPNRPARPRRDELGEGDEVGPWQLEASIAQGGCGSVFRATHRVLGRAAAVKVLHHELSRSPQVVARFVQEARAVNHIRHPGIVDIFDFGELTDGRPYFAMELLALENLEDRVEGCGRLMLVETADIVGQIGAALGAAHGHGYVHRDVKARNVGFAVAADGEERVKLLDFGVAKLLEPGPDGTIAWTQRVGTSQSMAPEQIKGDAVGAWTDVYGLGVMTFYMLAGRYPFETDDSTEMERMHLEDTPPPLGDLVAVPPAVERLVAAAMAKTPAERVSLDELVAGLAAAALPA